MSKVLVVIAHPDDEVLGCGGTIAKLSEDGHTVSVLLPTVRCDPRGRAQWTALLAGLERSCGILGATLFVPDTPLAETEAEPHVHLLHDLILPFVEGSDHVFTHWPGDANQVHRGVARAVEVATRPFRRRRNVSLFEVLTSTGQSFGSSGGGFAPTEYVVLEDRHARKKCDAMSSYESEIMPGRHVDDVDRQLRLRGAEIGVSFAEAFVVARRFA